MKAVKGGLDVADPENNDPAVIASAAIAVRHRDDMTLGRALD